MTVRSVPVGHHNAVLRRATAKAEKLEPRLAELLEPILDAAGRKAAAAFARMATNHLTAAGLALAASAPASSSTMICVKPRPEEAAAITDPDGEPTASIHVTLAYLGQTDGPLEDVAEPLRAVAALFGPLAGVVGGYGAFEPPGVEILLPDVPGLVELRVAVTEALVRAGIDYGRDHGFQAHLTVGDVEADEADPGYPASACGSPLHFDALLVVRGDTEIVEVPLVGVPALTAAAADPPPWSEPFPDEVIDVDALVKQIRAKTDPVRQAMVAATMTPALDAYGLDWSVTNPFAEKVLATAGAKVKDIAETTRLNVMRIIRASYENGLSIPNTAEAIRVGMLAASKTRAVMIARTELAGAVNGGSLAATQIVSDATGETYSKTWLTAPGAPHPRHEEYDGLDGQEQSLDQAFDVGGSALMFPGDPDGDPGETINCFPSGTLVEMPGLRAAMRRRYDGDLVHVRLASGDELAGTPNHPVLRADGRWVPLSEVKEGNHLVSALLAWDDAGAPDPERPPAAISEVYGLAEMVSDPERVRLTPPDLHGDGANGEIDVVTLDGDLLLDIEATSDEEVAELGLAIASAARARTSRGDGALAVFDGWGKHFAWSAAYGVGPSSQEATLLVVHPLHSQPISGRPVAYRKAEFTEAENDRGAADAELLADREDALTALVTLAEVTEIKVEPFHGEVFNLDTGQGWYTAASIVCRNCRCTMTYDTPQGQQEVSADDGFDPADL